MLAEQDNPAEIGQKERPEMSVATVERPKRVNRGRRGLDVNWGLIRADFIRPDMTAQQVADKWQISISTLIKRAYRERWSKSKRAFQESTGLAINQAVTQAVQAAKVAAVDMATKAATDKASQLVAEWVETAREQARKGVQRAGRLLDAELDPDGLRTVVSALDTADKVGRRALGLDRETGANGDGGSFKLALGLRLELLSPSSGPDIPAPAIDVEPV